MTDPLRPRPRPGRSTTVRAEGRPLPKIHRRRRTGGWLDESGAVTAEYAVLLPVVALILLAIVGVAGLGLQQVRNQDAAATAARLLARGESPVVAEEAVDRMAGESAELVHHRHGTWVTVTVRHGGHGPLAWIEAIEISAEAVAPVQSTGTRP